MEDRKPPKAGLRPEADVLDRSAGSGTEKCSRHY